MIIDVHTHIFPDHLAPKAVPALAAAAGVPAYLDGTLAQLLASMDRAGIDASVIAPVSTSPSQVRSINDFTASAASDRIIPFGTIHPEFDDAAAEIARMKNMGFRGVKFHPEYQVFHPDDMSIYPVYEQLERAGLMILFHAGIDIEIETLHGTPERFARVHEAFPGLTLILAHMGSFRMWDEVEEYLVGKNVYFDTSYVFDDIEPEQFRRIVVEHGPDKILFGTDSPWTDQVEEVARLRRCGLADEVVQQILGDNAARLFGL